MFEANAKLRTGILRDYGIGVFFAIFPKSLSYSKFIHQHCSSQTRKATA